jgi:RNA polymerase sigma factor for flagellar operon FliA
VITTVNDGINVEEIITEYLPRIKYYASRLAYNLPAVLSEDDLVSAGVIGLIEAIGRYDSSKKATLKTFSDCRIKGAIIDEIRAMVWASKGMRKKLSTFEEAYKSLEDRLSRSPSDEEVAEELGFSVKKLQNFLYVTTIRHHQSLHDVVVSPDGEVKELIDCIASNQSDDPAETLETKQAKQELLNAMERLSEREKLIISLYYFEEMTMKKIGSLIKLTESRICQLLSSAICKLRDGMTQQQFSGIAEHQPMDS